MSDYNEVGNDFDNLFELRESGDPSISNIPYSHQGTNLTDRYAPASAGDPGPAVEYHHNGSDIGPLFCALGTRPVLNAQNITVDAETGTGSSSEAEASWGSSEVGGTRWAGGLANGSVYGDVHQWLENGDPSDYEIRFTVDTGNPSSSFPPVGDWGSLDTGASIIAQAIAITGTDASIIDGTYDIREKGGSIVASGSFSLSAFAEA